MIPTYGPNPVDPTLVYAWPTRRVMAAADCVVRGGVHLDPDAVDPKDPGLDAAIAASLKAEDAATAPRPEVVPSPDPAGGTDDAAATTAADNDTAQNAPEGAQDATTGDSGPTAAEAAAAARAAHAAAQDAVRRELGRNGR